MRVYIQTQGFDLTPAIETHVQQQVSRNLGSMEEQIIAVDVFLGDVNGPKGGDDKKALFSIQLASRLGIRLETLHGDLYTAVSRAARRAKQTVKRTVRKQKQIRRAEIRRLRHLQGELQAL